MLISSLFTSLLAFFFLPTEPVKVKTPDELKQAYQSKGEYLLWLKSAKGIDAFINKKSCQRVRLTDF